MHSAAAMNGSNIGRREFCAHAISFAAAGSLLASCGGSPTSSSGGQSLPALPIVNGVTAGGAVTVSVDSGSPLATVGNAVLVQSNAGQFLVARTAQDSFTALTAVCTHQGCTVSNYQSGTYGCPCHGSEYSTSGAVRNGPATQPLRQFQTQFANNVLTISVA